MGPATGILAALALIAYVGFSGRLVEFFVPEVADQPLLPLSFPLPHAATVTQYGPDIAEPRTRFYVSTSMKAAQ